MKQGKDMTKVGVLCLSHFSGGMELDAIKYQQLFNRHGLASALICRQDTFLEQQAQKLGEQCFPIRFRRKLSLALIRQLRRVIQQQQITDLLFFGTSEIKSIRFAVRGTGCRVHVRYGTTMSTPKKDFLHRWLYRCVTYHIAISEHLKRNVLHIMPAEPQQVRVIYTPFAELPEPRKLPTDQPKLIHVGRVSPGKGQQDALQAMALCRHQPTINFYGGASDQTYLAKLQQLTKEHELSAHFCGHDDQITARLAEHNIFLFPSAGEGLPNSLIEALSLGLICICFDNTVFPEFKTLGFHLHLVPDGDHEALSKTVDNVIDHLEAELKSCRDNPVRCNELFGAGPIVEQWRTLLSHH